MNEIIIERHATGRVTGAWCGAGCYRVSSW